MTQMKLFESDLLGERYYRIDHPSGLPIYVFPKERISTYALFAANFGSVDVFTDEQGTERLPDGVAHFLEHKLFADEDDGDAFERFSALGADANAYTSHNCTAYLFSANEHAMQALGELIDFVSTPHFTEENVAREQGIIAEEIRACMDDPYDVCYYNLLGGLYENHPVRNEICGSVESIRTITPQVLYRAYRTFYRPSNMALVVCGDVTPEQVLAVADARLPQVAKEGAVPRSHFAEPPHAHRARTVAYGQTAKPVFSIGIKDVATTEKPDECIRRDVAINLLSEMMFSASNTFFNELFEEGLLTHDLSFEYARSREIGFLSISGEADDPDAVFSRVLGLIADLRKNGLSREDFERARRVEFAQFVKCFDSTEGIAGTLLGFALDGTEIFRYAEVAREIDFDYVSALFESFFVDGRYTLSIVLPNDTEGEV